MELGFQNFLASHNILVQHGAKCKTTRELQLCESVLLADYGIVIRNGRSLLSQDMLGTMRNLIAVVEGRDGVVPDGFYREFPLDDKAIPQYLRVIDQKINYAITYGLGNFDELRHSIFEIPVEERKELPFADKLANIKVFDVLSEEDAVAKLDELVRDMAQTTRQLNPGQFTILDLYIKVYQQYNITFKSKYNAIVMLCENRKHKNNFDENLILSDVFKVVEYMVGCPNVNNLHLINSDRKFISNLLDKLITRSAHGDSFVADIRTCIEKRKFWKGLLHHIHYNPGTDRDKKFFVECIRYRKDCRSIYSDVERALAHRDVYRATSSLEKKGAGAVLRNANYLLSRCNNDTERRFVANSMGRTQTPIVPLLQYYLNESQATADVKTARSFAINRGGLVKIHRETEKEVFRRRSFVDTKTRQEMAEYLLENYNDRLLFAKDIGKVYIDKDMRKIALPIYNSSANGGINTLPSGSRVALNGNNVRLFTFWRKVNDIDLSTVLLDKDFNVIKVLNWQTGSRTGWNHDLYAFSGDCTTGFNGGVEYFDFDLAKIREEEPEVAYIISGDNVYSRATFQQCECYMGYMLRSDLNAGKAFDYSTVSSKFRVTADSSLCATVAIDMAANELVWINMSLNSNERVINPTELLATKRLMGLAKNLNYYDFYTGLASDVVDKIEEADYIVSDKPDDVAVRDDQVVVRSTDVEKTMALLESRC